jgi:glycosyltransferase involved in cell wall biosynthesis
MLTVDARAAASPGRPFRVLTVFNCGSSLYRKNPMALIEAFKRAFGADEGAELILKVSDGAQHRADLVELERQIGGAHNIRIVDEMMDDAMLDRLMRSADVYASLHRSEGFGLTVAEAIMRELPVVVTDWSGTTDYCAPDLAYTVDCTLVPVDDPHPAYCMVRGARWAEPSVEAAARRLAEIRANPEQSRRRAAELKRRLVTHIAGNGYARAVESLLDGTAAALARATSPAA